MHNRIILSLVFTQHEIKTGFVFLHSCDGCPSHETVIELAQGLFQEASAALQVLQPGPALPPSPTDYTGTYVTNEVGTIWSTQKR